MKRFFHLGILPFLFALLLSFVAQRSAAQPCIPPEKQVILHDPFNNYYVYWKPATGSVVIDYKVQVMCFGFPPCMYSVHVTDTNVLYMNGGYLGVKVPPLPTSASIAKLSITAPACPDQFAIAFVLTLDIITDNLDIVLASCDSDTCKLVVNKWTKLKKLTNYANSKCGGGGASVAPSTVSAIDAPIDISLRKNGKGKWQMKSTDTLKCDSCYAFNFQITCPSGAIYYVQDTICFNYTGPDIGCRNDGFLEEDQSLTIYPNPATNHCTIRFYNVDAASCRVSIFNTMGKLIRVANVQLDEGLNEIDLDVSELPTGLYILQLSTPKNPERLKLMKF